MQTKNYRLKKALSLLLVGIIQIQMLCFWNPVMVSFAKTENLDIISCGNTYFKDLGVFLETIVGFHGFFGNFSDYVLDIFERNTCHAYDILMLDKQLDKIKRDIQQAYLKCKPDKIPDLKTAYFKTDAEIYYVRHIVDSSIDWVSTLSLGLVSSKEKSKEQIDQAGVFKDPYGDMVSKYTSVVGGKEEFDKLYKNLQIKYSERKYNYVQCKSGGGWQEVQDKWKEFINNWGGAKEAGEEFKKDVVGGAQEIKESFPFLNFSKNPAVKAPPYTFGTFLQNTFDVSINGVTPKKAFQDIMSDASKSFVTYSPNISTVYNTVGNEDIRYKLDIDRAKLEAKYKTLYLQTTDSAIAEFLGSLDALKKTIKESVLYAAGITKCVRTVLSKQCP